tara:strand:+ start:1070 stop:1228 length:159 start_codon:yes stop_codon:yes gene_type:complete
MKNVYIIIAMLFILNACSIGKKCTYTQDGTKMKSWIWFYKSKPIDLEKYNCD